MTILEIINTVYARWGQALSEKTPIKENYSMENSTVVNSLPYSTLFFNGIPGNTWDLEGDESTVVPTLQVDIYTKGQRALTQAYEIDAVSHETLTRMGFRRVTGAELIQSTDPSIKRLTSRYSRVVGYGDKLPE